MEWLANSSFSLGSTQLIIIIITIFSSTLIFPILLLRGRRTASGGPRLPPGPPGWPVFGNLFDLMGPSPHKSVAEMRPKYGDVVRLRLGAIDTVAVLSARAAAELFRSHDLSFSDRTVTETSRAHLYHEGSLALAPYGPRWRLMRRLLAAEMLAGRRIAGSAPARRRCVDRMLAWVERGEGKTVRVAHLVFLMSFNLLGQAMVSEEELVAGPESEEASEFFEAMAGVMEWGGRANVADVFPWLRWADPQGLRRSMERDLGRAMRIAARFVDDRIHSKNQEEEKKNVGKDFLDVLIEFQGNGNDDDDEPRQISHRDINIFILEIFMAGSETTSSTVEWAMTELLRSPETMAKVKEELNQVIGRSRKVEESDIENLLYLNAVVKETLRLHPPIPFLVPRKAVQDTNFMGHFVPKNTQLFVNAWAIGRDPDVWADEPLSFKPERFMSTSPNSSTSDYRGQHYELIPFGAGRRMCAGVPLAHRVLHLALGSLLHHFEWRLAEGVDPQSVDMRERLGITIRKFEPLLAIPTKCA